MKKLKIIALIAAALVLIPSIYLVYSLSNNSIFLLTVLSGSMSPAMDPGDVIVISKVDSNEVKKGDIITFKEGENFVTHRVIEIKKESDTKFITKGDANEDPDQRLVSSEEIKGKVVFTIPKMGYLGNFVRTPLGFILLILIPGLLIIFSEVNNILKISNKKKNK